jgi:hypothetical protein
VPVDPGGVLVDARPLVLSVSIACGVSRAPVSSGCADLGCVDGLVFVVETTPAPDGAQLAVELTVGGERHACTAVAAVDLIVNGCGDFVLWQLPYGYELRGIGDYPEPADVHLVFRVNGEAVFDGPIDATWTNDTGYTATACRTCWSVEGTVVVGR